MSQGRSKHWDNSVFTKICRKAESGPAKGLSSTMTGQFKNKNGAASLVLKQISKPALFAVAMMMETSGCPFKLAKALGEPKRLDAPPARMTAYEGGTTLC
jgi:hypothetical protein